MPASSGQPLRIGLVSDTHNLLRPEALEYLSGSDHIVHGGDICGEAVLAALRELAPLTVVRGNNDRGAWADGIPHDVTVNLGGVPVHVVHDLAELQLPAAVRVVVTGHSHKPKVEERAGVLYVNPGSAGPRRFKLPISAAELLIAGGDVAVHLHSF